MTELSDFKARRGTLKGRLTTFDKYISGFTAGATCTEVQIIEIRVRSDKIHEVFKEFDKVQQSIENSVKDDELATQEYQRLEFESQFYRSVARAEELMCSNKNSTKFPSAASSDAGDDTLLNQSKFKGVRLPTINLPKFSGDYGNWLEFRDTFVSLIHENESISSIQKFHYLRASLEGSAAQVIRALEFSASNYTVAWNALRERYDNTRLLVQNHIKALFDEEAIKKESADSIRRILDSYTKNLRALQILGEPICSWDTLIIYIITSKLDPRTLRDWEEEKIKYDKLTFDILSKFLKDKANLMETIELSSNTIKQECNKQVKQPTKTVKALTTIATDTPTRNYKCSLCSENHLLYLCPKFAKMGVDDREEFVKSSKVCANCLRPGHHKRTCRLGPCRTCKKRHNTLLHREFDTPPTPPTATSTTLSANTYFGQVLLATALVKVGGSNNTLHEVRAVLDSGSQASFISQSLLNKLGLPTQQSKITVTGINNSISSISLKCNTTIQSRLNDFKANVTFLVLPHVTSHSNYIMNVSTLNIPSHVTLADPEFYNPSSLDVLLGADIFWDVLGNNQVRLNNAYPVLTETKFGYVISGPTGQPQSSSLSTNYCQFDSIQEQLAKFWAVEEVPDSQNPVYSIEELSCEKHFMQSMSRESDGRFSVGIPLKQPESVLGESFNRAKHCFLSLERRFQTQPTLKGMYIDFMTEYEQLGHMTKGDIHNLHPHSYFLPHHGVLREQSTTTKLRAVFNASAPTSSGLSFNEIQMVGPTIQSDLLSILLRFRQHRYVLAGDIKKMYRQVLIHKHQRHLQQIIWRNNSSKPLESYTLNTVTYGTASAPFLAVRCLKQLAVECDDLETLKIIEEDFYIDDLLTGYSTVEGLMRIRSLVTNVLAGGCFNLRKFRSNLPICDNPDSSNSSVVVDLSEHTQSSMLGLKWSPSTDQLHFVIKPHDEVKMTKRSILSAISQVFDPLGVLSLYIITGKMLLQRLWLHKLQWDDPLPQDVIDLWNKFAETLTHLNDIRIPRHVICNDPVDIQLHAFSDASKDAFGACVFIRSETKDGNEETHLLFAKSRVAPLRANTFPRLQLCGAMVAANLVDKAFTTTRLTFSKCVLWTDSSVVLGWLKTPPNKLRQFVKNRVSDIQELTQNHTWRHVPTAQNPADLLSRGVTTLPTDDNTSLWWHGPPFLTDCENNWPNRKFKYSEESIPEVMVNVAVTSDNPELFPFSRFSNLNNIIHTMVHVLRFINICKKRVSKSVGPITFEERENSYASLLRLAQKETFVEQYHNLSNGQPLRNKDKLLIMSPFLDYNGLIRVGGRLTKGKFDFNKKHPVLMSSKHPFTKLIFESEHRRLMHAGPQLLLSSVRETVWPLGGRNLSKKVVHKCLRCFRLNAKTVNPIMGNLPEQRINPGYPFQTTAMDYAGPLIALNKRGRGSRTEKVYVAIFVCFTTKSIHLELVSDLSKDSFLSALRRFIARRSKPQILYSDNGTQFVGAKNEIYTFLQQNNLSITSELQNEGIQFKFIPAYTPHFAGLAEAGVKSVKMHLRRVLGNAHLVFEDLYTILVQIESILNSRPLTPLSSDPNDLAPLTPGHFLVGRPLTALPTPMLIDAKENRLTRFQRLEYIRQQFWQRWHKEYLSELQQRTKWRSCKGSLKKGTLVLIKDDFLPPMKWSLGRVVQLYPGSDGVTRVADLKTSKGIIRRAFNRICPLPIDDSTKEG